MTTDGDGIGAARVAVVGHHEWVEFVSVERVPAAGEIVHGEPYWEGPAGGAPVAAGQLARLAGEAHLFTALGDDDVGRRAVGRLAELGLEVHATFRRQPTRRAFTHIDATGERTITVMGARLGPEADDPLPWHLLENMDAVYFTAGDVGALRAARAARVLVATARVLEVLADAGVRLDALVRSATDPAERAEPGDIDPPPRLVVTTEGAAGGTYHVLGKAPARYDPVPPPGPIADRYGAGDSFAAGLTFALGAGLAPPEAVAVAARCGASAVTGRGPYAGQLSALHAGVAYDPPTRG